LCQQAGEIREALVEDWVKRKKGEGGARYRKQTLKTPLQPGENLEVSETRVSITQQLAQKIMGGEIKENYPVL